MEDENHARMARIEQARKAAKAGVKDWCEKIVLRQQDGILAIPGTYQCHTYGVVSEVLLRNEGWAITNKQARSVEYGIVSREVLTVYDIAIEKMPR
ncbi:hypothetical protein [Ralstonia insidiosa]|uniref:Uncharacterized protein n=1 Tax=Ralstonia insidiosa TaxID=190721 RepID=A0A848P2H8_9RALS|nr:hypothetical protein [Ralstonia insidiosa]NMV37868.1 hypothetical protein [Ralstonia insidiosa]